MAARRAATVNHARGDSGTPVTGHCRTLGPDRLGDLLID